MRDLMDRAYSAYFRACAQNSVLTEQPNTGYSGIETHDGRQYVVLKNGNGILAVYRVKSDGVLKRLKRWPSAVGA